MRFDLLPFVTPYTRVSLSYNGSPSRFINLGHGIALQTMNTAGFAVDHRSQSVRWLPQIAAPKR